MPAVEITPHVGAYAGSMGGLRDSRMLILVGAWDPGSETHLFGRRCFANEMGTPQTQKHAKDIGAE